MTVRGGGISHIAGDEYARFDEDEDRSSGVGSRNQDNDANLAPVPFSSVEDRVNQTINEEERNASEEPGSCYLCKNWYFAADLTPLQTDILKNISHSINLVNLDYLWKEVGITIDEHRKKEALETTGVYEAEELSIGLIRTHFQFHVNDPEIERRFQIDKWRKLSVFLSDRLVGVNPQTQNEEVNEKNFKLLLMVQAKISKLQEVDTSSSKFALADSMGSKKRPRTGAASR